MDNFFDKGLEKRKELGLSKLQNYIPIYESFFTTTKKNFNTFNLNQKYHIERIVFNGYAISAGLNFFGFY